MIPLIGMAAATLAPQILQTGMSLASNIFQQSPAGQLMNALFGQGGQEDQKTASFDFSVDSNGLINTGFKYE